MEGNVATDVARRAEIVRLHGSYTRSLHLETQKIRERIAANLADMRKKREDTSAR